MVKMKKFDRDKFLRGTYRLKKDYKSILPGAVQLQEEKPKELILARTC